MTGPTPLRSEEFSHLMTPFGLRQGTHVAVAVSGGADSVALAMLLKAWGETWGVRVTALTVDHRLRTEAHAEAEQVGAWLHENGLPHHILTWDDGPGTKSAVQARARVARYDLMAAWCRDHGAAHLFTAHHQGDQAETFVMRLKRSSTLHGLAAMAPKRDLGGGVTLCRPLLDIPKDRLVATLEALGQSWIEDPSNQNPAFERVRVRALIKALEADGVTSERLAGAAKGARLVTRALDRAVAAFERDAVKSQELDQDQDRGMGIAIAIDARALADLPVPVAERVLSLNLTAVGGRAYPPAPDKIQRLTRAVRQPGFRARTLGGCVVRLGRGALTIRPEPPRSTVFRALGGGM